MNFASVAAEYIRNHRDDCTDAEIRKALKEQGFSDEILADAFHEAGERPKKAAPVKKDKPGLRFLVWVLWAISALLLVGALALFARNLRNAAPVQAPPSTQTP
jgi:hypothetical protein